MVRRGQGVCNTPLREADLDGETQGERFAVRVAVGAGVDASEFQGVAAAEEGDQGAGRVVAVGRADAVAGVVCGGDYCGGDLGGGEGSEEPARDVGDEVAEAIDVDDLAVDGPGLG